MLKLDCLPLLHCFSIKLQSLNLQTLVFPKTPAMTVDEGYLTGNDDSTTKYLLSNDPVYFTPRSTDFLLIRKNKRCQEAAPLSDQELNGFEQSILDPLLLFLLV